MKKGVSLILLCGVLVSIFSIYKIKTIENPSIDDISKKLIRFHVIANSDEEKDQALKLKVRDEVLTYISPKLKNSKSIEESREIIKNENENMINIAKNIVIKNGYNYSVESTLSKEYFPVKTYGNITLPQGKYEAYRILIGEGNGQNWWCVMFPPLCFVDVSKGNIAYEETEKSMKEVLNKEEFEIVNNQKNSIENSQIKNENKIVENNNKNEIKSNNIEKENKNILVEKKFENKDDKVEKLEAEKESISNNNVSNEQINKEIEEKKSIEENNIKILDESKEDNIVIRFKFLEKIKEKIK